MSWTRFNEDKYYLHEDNSFDSASEETGRQYAAFFSEKMKPANEIIKPRLTPDHLTLQKQALLQQFPSCTQEINALSYYYGLFTPEDHIAHSPQYTRYFNFFTPEQSEMSHTEIARFKNDLQDYCRQPSKDTTS